MDFGEVVMSFQANSMALPEGGDFDRIKSKKHGR